MNKSRTDNNNKMEKWFTYLEKFILQLKSKEFACVSSILLFLYVNN